MNQEHPSAQKRYHLNLSFLEQPRTFGPISLVQIGRMHCTEHTVVGEHPHRNWFELTVITDGKGTITTNRISVPVCRGQIYLSFPGDLHRIATDADSPLKFDFLSFYTEEPALREELEAIMQDCMDADRRILSDDRIQSLVSNAIAEISNASDFSDIILECSFRQIVCYLLRGLRSLSVERPHAKTGHADELCYRIMNYIDTHLYTMQGLSTLADELCYNYSYLSDRFREVTGDTLQHYYRRRRLETARLLLLEGSLRVGAVAEQLRYSSIYPFSRAFKEEFGISPSALLGDG